MELFVKNGAIPVFKTPKTEEYSVELNISTYKGGNNLLSSSDVSGWIGNITGYYEEGEDEFREVYYTKDGVEIFSDGESVVSERDLTINDTVRVWDGNNYVQRSMQDIYEEEGSEMPNFRNHFRTEYHPNIETYWLRQPRRAIKIIHMLRDPVDNIVNSTLTIGSEDKEKYRYVHGRVQVTFIYMDLEPITDGDGHTISYRYVERQMIVQNNFYENSKWISTSGKLHEEVIANVELTKTSTN